MIDNLSDETYIFINSVNRRVAIFAFSEPVQSGRPAGTKICEPHLGEVLLNKKGVGRNVNRR